MSAPPRHISEPDPTAYTPREIGDAATAAAVAGAQELLTWMRANGYRCQSIQIGAVQVIGVVDDYPRRRPEGIDGPQFEE